MELDCTKVYIFQSGHENDPDNGRRVRVSVVPKQGLIYEGPDFYYIWPEDEEGTLDELLGIAHIAELLETEA